MDLSALTSHRFKYTIKLDHQYSYVKLEEEKNYIFS